MTEAIRLSEMVVTPGSYSIMGSGPIRGQTLGRQAGPQVIGPELHLQRELSPELLDPHQADVAPGSNVIGDEPQLERLLLLHSIRIIASAPA